MVPHGREQTLKAIIDAQTDNMNGHDSIIALVTFVYSDQ